MEEYIDSLGSASIFSTLDAKSRYWKVVIDEKDCKNTEFTSHNLLFCVTHMSFGLKNAPGTLQAGMEVLLTNVKWKVALVNLGDIVIILQLPTEHIYRV